ANKDLNTLTTKNYFEMYTVGVKSFQAFMQAIESAQQNMYIQTYVFKNDTTSKLVINALLKNAAEGVEIKMMIDSLGYF
ncbi:phospholipase D-like domain-containing protein, partial [Francisella tularensis]|uniref:phospholipase D-like domain-containing protein n=1 Tax=Francisella tularensis TaxID=263 RepID=UPI0023ADCD6A|nr:cardiolipin synthase [Francisella tularensis subsp. holarctica]